MSGVAKAVGGLVLSPVGAMAGLFKSKKKAPAAETPANVQPRAITRNDAVAARMQDDERRRRRGMGSNILLGMAGAEARTAGGKVLLGQ